MSGKEKRTPKEIAAEVAQMEAEAAKAQAEAENWDTAFRI